MSSVDPFHVLAAIGIEDALDATPVAGGWSTTLWKIQRPEGAYALRLFPAGERHWATIEAQTMRGARAAGVPVPEIHSEGEWRDQPVLLLSWCDGRTLLAEMHARPWAIRRLGYQFGRQQAMMHATPVSSSNPHLRPWLTRFGDVDEELRERLQACQPREDRLLHLDYHPLNVMVARGQISCILDWANAARGEPRADVARTWSILRLMPLRRNRADVATEAGLRLLAAGWLRGYQAIAGPLHDMTLFKVWAGEAMVRDLSQHVGKPGMWITEHHLATIQQRVNTLRRQAGLASPSIVTS